jgi:hypothetical protein
MTTMMANTEITAFLRFRCELLNRFRIRSLCITTRSHKILSYVKHNHYFCSTMYSTGNLFSLSDNYTSIQ